jgi:hypothetical protein
MLYTCNWKIPSLKLSCVTNNPDRGITWISSVSSDECRDNSLKQAINTPSKYSFTLYDHLPNPFNAIQPLQLKQHH